MSGNVKVVLPAPSYDMISGSLYSLSEALAKLNPGDQVHGLFGGEYGYGQDFVNEVFEMHPFDWDGDCDCGAEGAIAQWDDEHDHCAGCYYLYATKITISDLGIEGWSKQLHDLAEQWGLPEQGSACHCTCGWNKAYQATRDLHPCKPTCRSLIPNFHHFASGVKVEWYKYIGRGTEINKEITAPEWNEIINECFESIQ